MAKEKAAAATSRQSAAPPVEYASAMDKIRDEMAKSKDSYTQVVGEYLTAHLLAHPEGEAALMDRGKSIKGSLEAVRKEAEKVKQGNMAVLDDRTLFGIVLGYFGIESGLDVLKTGPDVLKTEQNEIEPSAIQKPSPTGEGGSAPALTEEVPVHLPDPFDLDALMGVI